MGSAWAVRRLKLYTRIRGVPPSSQKLQVQPGHTRTMVQMHVCRPGLTTASIALGVHKQFSHTDTQLHERAYLDRSHTSTQLHERAYT